LRADVAALLKVQGTESENLTALLATAEAGLGVIALGRRINHYPGLKTDRAGTSGAIMIGRLCAVTLCLCLAGCELRGAPSYNIFGAFFPASLLCAGLGLFGSVLFRGLLIASGLDDAIRLKLVVYIAFAAGLAVWLWLGLFGDL
jgi:YtcA family